VAQHGREQLAAGCLAGVLTGRLHQPDATSDLLGLCCQPQLGFRQHGCRRIEQRHLVAGPGEREGLVASATANVQHCGWGLGEVLHQLVVEHEGTDLPLHRGVRLVHELVGHRRPGIVIHGPMFAAGGTHSYTSSSNDRDRPVARPGFGDPLLVSE